MKKLLKEKKAITLIALVITIVVLVILAAVVITMTVGNDGLIARAIRAANGYKDAQDKDKQDINDLYGQLQVATDGTVTVDYDTLQSYITQEVNNKTSALESRVAKLEQNTIRYVDYTRVLDNTSLKSQNASYTATEDCVVIGALTVYDNYAAPLYVDGINVSSICNQAAVSNKFTSISVSIFVKKGSVVKTRKDHGTYDLTVYGLKSL